MINKQNKIFSIVVHAKLRLGRMLHGVLSGCLRTIRYLVSVIRVVAGVVPRFARPLLSRIARTRFISKLVAHYRKIHHHVAHRPHQHLMARSNLYNRWHSWQYKWLHHGHVHGATTIAAVLTMTVMVMNSLGNVYALSTWQQTDWSGGQGSSTSNQYAGATDINTTVAGEAKLPLTPDWYLRHVATAQDYYH